MTTRGDEDPQVYQISNCPAAPLSAGVWSLALSETDIKKHDSFESCFFTLWNGYTFGGKMIPPTFTLTAATSSPLMDSMAFFTAS